MPPSHRPASVTAAVALVAISAVLTVVSVVLHISFSRRVDRLLDSLDGVEVRVDGWTTALWLAEPGKLLVIGAVVSLWYAMRRRNERARVAVAVAMGACVAVYAAAALNEGVKLAAVFFFATMMSAANSLSGGSGLPEGPTLGLGLMSVAADALLLGLAAACVVLLSSRPCREYLRS